MTQKKPKQEPPGPEPETLKIEGDWDKAVKKALTKKPQRPPAKPKQARRRGA